ncbi:MAG: porin family protein, partial [Candidatus Zixiibacteriota bacterium]
MKKQLMCLTTAILIFAGVASAQTTFDFGLKGGGCFNKMSGDPDLFLLLQSKYSSFADSTVETDTDGRSGFHGGAFLTINLNGPVSIQPEIIYSVKGVKEIFEYTYNSQDYKTSLSLVLTYVEIPVLIKYNFPTSGKIKPRLYAGPALAFNVDGKFKGGTESNVEPE